MILSLSKISFCFLLCWVCINAVPVKKRLNPEDYSDFSGLTNNQFYESEREEKQEAYKQIDASVVTPLVTSVLSAAGTAISPALGPLGPILGTVLGPAITNAGSQLVTGFLNQATSAFTGGVFLNSPSVPGQPYMVYAVPVQIPSYTSYYGLPTQGLQDSYLNPIIPEVMDDNKYKPAILEENEHQEEEHGHKHPKKPAANIELRPVYGDIPKIPPYAKFPLKVDDSFGKKTPLEAKPTYLGIYQLTPVNAGAAAATSAEAVSEINVE